MLQMLLLVCDRSGGAIPHTPLFMNLLRICVHMVFTTHYSITFGLLPACVYFLVARW